MYAYKQQFVENDLYTNIPRKVVSRPIKNKSLSKKVKKKNVYAFCYRVVNVFLRNCVLVFKKSCMVLMIGLVLACDEERY